MGQLYAYGSIFQTVTAHNKKTRMSDGIQSLPELRPYHRLSYKLLRWVLLTALIAGGTLSVVQIFLDASRARIEMDDQAQQMLAVMRDPATQAVYSLDPELADQVVDGLFEQRAVIYASIHHPDGTYLTQRERPLRESSFRHLTDPIFQQQRTYEIPLIRGWTVYGGLSITLDTAETASAFLERSLVLFASGLAKACILALIVYAVYYYLLTAPLMSIIRSLLNVDPASPAQKKIPLPKRHQKDELGLWVKIANQLLQSIEDSQQQRLAAEARVLKMTQYDALTGLPNRALFRSHLQSALEDARRLHQKAALFWIGIDDFKSINDQYGYAIGDQLLQAVAERLTEHSEVFHTLCRVGGDQFVILQYNIGAAFRAVKFAESLLRSLHSPFFIEHRRIHLQATIGIALFPDDDVDADKLLQKAEQTMMLAKTTHRNQFTFYVASVDSELRQRKQLERDLFLALENGQFQLVYQPQIDIRSGEVIGAEALLRWIHPVRGNIPPDQFIPIAEANDSICEIGTWVINQACRQLRQWHQEGIDLQVAVNLSAIQLRQRNIVDIIRKAIHTNQLLPHQLELEITETSFMENLSDAVDTLRSLREFGVSCAVDDFGTGYSSLSYLKQLPIDKIKIDRQFIKDLETGDNDTSIVSAIIQLGRSLKLGVIAEGVETLEQKDYLLANGCTEAQGYYYSKPLTAEEFRNFYYRHNKPAAQASMP